MFQALHELATSTELHMTITAQGDDLRVVILPKPKDGANAALSTPLALTASPAELDEKFVATLSSYTASRKSLKETLDETTSFMEAAKQAAKDAAKKSTPSPVKQQTASPSATKTEEPAVEKPAAKPATDDISLF